MKAENRGQMVRGVVAVGFDRSGSISFNREEMDQQGNVVAYTPWHSHDDDLSVVERELDALVEVYGSFTGCDCMSYRFEYKDYKS